MSWAKPKIFYKQGLDETTATLEATSTASGYSVDNIIDRLDSTKWRSAVTSTQYITLSPGYTVGSLTHIDSDDQGDAAYGVWGDGDFIYIANSTGGIHSYEVDVSGNLTHIDSDDQGNIAYGVWGDGDFIYLANQLSGLLSFSVDVDGLLTHIDSDFQGDQTYGVWGDGDFIYIANSTGGIHSYSVDVSGNLTHIDSDDQGNVAYGVWGDGDFIYLAQGTGGLRSYEVDVSGNLTHIDSDDQGDDARAVWGDGDFIYLANYTGGIHSYEVDVSGNLTHIDSDDQGGAARAVWGDGDFIYLANKDGGLHVYITDIYGNLTHIDSDDQGDLAYGVWGDGDFIYLANYTGGLHSFSDSSAIISNTADYLIIHGHNLGTAGATITLQYSTDDVTYSDAFTAVAMTADTTYLKEFTEQTARYWRLKIENATVEPEIAICYWGETVELEYCENSFDPNAFSDNSIVNMGQNGHVLGIYETYKNRNFTLSWNDAEAALYDKIKDLVDTVGRENFVIAWELTEHSDAVYLVRAGAGLTNPYTRQAQYRNISLELTGRKEE